MSYNNFIPVVWSAQMIKALHNDNVAVSLSDTRYSSEAKFGDAVKINGIGKVSIRDYVKGSPLTRDGWADQSTIIRIDQQKYFNFGVDDIDKRQAKGNLITELRAEASLALADDADSFIYSHHADAGVKVTKDSVTSANILSTITEAIKGLYKNNIPKNAEISLEATPDFMEKMLLADILFGKPNDDAFKNGFVGRLGKWLNVKVYMTNNLPNVGGKDKIFLRTKRAIAYVDNMNNVEAYRPEDSFEDAVKGLHVYGAKVVRPAELAVITCGYGAETAI